MAIKRKTANSKTKSSWWKDANWFANAVSILAMIISLVSLIITWQQRQDSRHDVELQRKEQNESRGLNLSIALRPRPNQVFTLMPGDSKNSWSSPVVVMPMRAFVTNTSSVPQPIVDLMFSFDSVRYNSVQNITNDAGKPLIWPLTIEVGHSIGLNLNLIVPIDQTTATLFKKKYRLSPKIKSIQLGTINSLWQSDIQFSNGNHKSIEELIRSTIFLWFHFMSTSDSNRIINRFEIP
jgi:hypothetical protein